MEQQDIPLYLITRYLSGEASDHDKALLLKWVNRDVKNKEILSDFEKVWENSPNPFEGDVESALGNINRRLNLEDSDPVKKPLLITYWKVAAALALVTLVGIGVMRFKNSSPERTAVTWIQTKSESGKRASVTLPDGSTVVLNGNSFLQHPNVFNDSLREVYLVGEAFFSVQRDVHKRFAVHTGDVTTEVLGTSFNVNAETSFITVSVKTGRVKVSAGSQSELIRAREKVTYNESKKLIKGKTNLDLDLAWLTNTLVFENAPLNVVAKKLEQFYGIEVVLHNADISRCTLTGTFKNETLNNVLQSISYSTDIKSTMTGNKVILSGKGCR